MGRFRTLFVALVFVLATAPRPASAAGSAYRYPHGRMLGVIPHAHDRPTGKAHKHKRHPMTYHGGPVMHSSNVHEIFWGPSYFSASYANLIVQYFTDVAYDSGKRSNVYSVGTQYFGPRGKYANYRVTDAGPITYSGSYPNDCPIQPGFGACVSDAAIESVVMGAIGFLGSATGLGDIYFVFLPQGVDVCEPGGSPCFSSNPGFCAYHSWFQPSDFVLYTVQPYEASGDCSLQGQPRPNGDDADVTLNGVSHEHNETITDPTGRGWFTKNLSGENGDKCNFVFGRPIGSTAFGQFNQNINGHAYLLQREWSNNPLGCRRKR